MILDYGQEWFLSILKVGFITEFFFRHLTMSEKPASSVGQSVIIYIWQFKSLGIYVLGSSSVDLLMCRSWNFEYYVLFGLNFLCLIFTEKINFLLVKQRPLK